MNALHFASGPMLGRILADHDQGPEYAVVECTQCDSIACVDWSAALSDMELVAKFVAMGWSITPTCCPVHSSAARETGEQQ